jgi:hypothetical protein
MTLKIFTIAHVPPELLQAWLQHLRELRRAIREITNAQVCGSHSNSHRAQHYDAHEKQ